MRTTDDFLREYSGAHGFFYFSYGHPSPELKHEGSCTYCGGYKTIKCQSGFGEVEWLTCGRCLGSGLEPPPFSAIIKNKLINIKKKLYALV